MNIRKVASLGLAVALQVLPITRVFVATTSATGSSFAIVSTWIAGALALMGGVDAVSGASSISITPATATTGVAFSGVVQYSGAHAGSAQSWELKNNWSGAQTGCGTSYQIAPGLWLTNAATYLVRVGGTPTTSGTFSFTMKIHSGLNCGGGDSDTRSASITIAAGAATAPSITTQPVSQTVTAGANVSFTVAASGTAPLSYQWLFNGGNLGGATSATLSLTGVTVGQAGSYTCVVTNALGSATSSAATLTVNPPPVAPSITTQPVSQTVTAGANVSFTVAASGTAPLSYQWQLNGANLGGATSATLSLTGVTAGQAGSYTCVVTNVAGSATSSAATLTVNVPPTITTQPVSQTVTAGANVSFTVAASGTAPLSYQWLFNGGNLGGATSATLSLTAVTVGQAGSYTCVVTNGFGSATSSAATLTVNPPPVAPSITTQPVSQTVTAGANVSFTVAASGTAPLSYQWQLNGANLGGATSATLSLTGVTAGQAGSYTCVVTNVAGSATSSAATLTVNVPPTITTQPVSQSVTAGTDVIFTVAASGTAPLSYQWLFNGGNLGGATSATLTLTGVTAGQAGNYSCVVTNVAGSATSTAAILTVNVAAVAPSITTQPVSQTVTAGANVSFTVAASGTTPLSYQWLFNGGNLGGATSATLSLTGVTVGQAGSYTCVVTNAAGSATSSAATLAVNPAPVAPSITTQPVSQTVTAGANVSFTVAASGTAPLSYQWRLNAVNLGGATSATLSLTGVTAGQAGSYTCVVTNVAGSATSSAATLIVNPVTVAPSITTQPVSQTVTAGGNVSFTVAASGTAPLSYQWKQNGANVTGGTSATLSLTGVTAGQAGSYTCLVTNVAGSATSSIATLTVQTALNAYAAAAGNYNGLFFESDQVRVRSAGDFNLHTDTAGNYSGWLQVGFARYSISGKLDANLTATNVIARWKVAPITIEFRIGQNSEAGQAFGRVTDGVWSSLLSGGRPLAYSPYAGDYTVVIPGLVGDPYIPAGDSYATLHVGADGLATMSGALADGIMFAQSAYVTAQGDWPLCVSLYSANGVIVSWLHFANLPSSDVSGTLAWVKQAGASPTSYPAGFTNETTAVGSLYVAPTVAGKAINLSTAAVVFSGGTLAASFTNAVSVNTGSQVVNLSPNQMSLSIATGSGTFTGQVAEPGTGVLHTFGGAVLQKQNAGFGFMKGINASGRVVFATP